MDAVGAASSIISLVDLSNRVINFLSGLKNANEDRVVITQQIQANCSILQSIAKRQNEKLPNLSSLVVGSGPLAEYKRILEELVPKVTTAKGLKDLPEKIKFVAKKKDIQELLGVLERCKSTFIFCSQEDALSLLLDMNQTLSAVENKIESLRRQDKKQTQTQAQAPSFVMPFSDESHGFVGRKRHLEILEKGLKTGSRRVALYGLGGVGKSRIAIESIYRVKKNSPLTSIFWVHASDKSRYAQVCETIVFDEIPDDFKAARVKMDAIHLVQAWLSRPQCGQWLLVLDNADDIRLFASGSDERTHSILSAIPHSPQGSIIITTRNYNVALQLVDDENFRIQVLEMEMDEGIDFFRRMLPKDLSSDEDVRDLVTELDKLPLAMKQAAAYIQASMGTISLSDYLELFRTNEVNQKELLEKNFGDTTRDSDLTNSVILTLQISLDLIKAQRPGSADLLSFMAVLGETIPYFLIRASTQVDAIDFQDDLNLLIQFSMVSLNTAEADKDFTTFKLHRLVHVTVCRWLEKENSLISWSEKALRVVSPLFSEAHKAFYGDDEIADHELSYNGNEDESSRFPSLLRTKENNRAYLICTSLVLNGVLLTRNHRRKQYCSEIQAIAGRLEKKLDLWRTLRPYVYALMAFRYGIPFHVKGKPETANQKTIQET